MATSDAAAIQRVLGVVGGRDRLRNRWRNPNCTKHRRLRIITPDASGGRMTSVMYADGVSS